MEKAPFYDEIAEGPASGRAYWVKASDGVRIRVGLWSPEGARGTVLLFPGRTEYIEKYGRAAVDLAARGYATLTIDWRGQGLADRLSGDRSLGHIGQFTDYQKDVAAALEVAEAEGLPKPYYLIAHSMGGAIGLRALLEGAPVEAAMFTAPMWGIRLAAATRPAAWAVAWGSVRLGLGHVFAPGTTGATYVLTCPFGENKLTTDREMWDYMFHQARLHPEMSLGGPSLHWLHESLREMQALARRPAPDVPCVTFLGTDEEIVDPARIVSRMGQWPGGRLEMVESGRHEVMMETPEVRARVFDTAAELFVPRARSVSADSA
ncbi:alpha/beta fold hydrolase [Pseudooceanicola nanhaiensis]|uniref:alpha/beta fold hydrolase n=1 Tax=Pseudooceanicola nanhaiensis TaxID=375761 RepID=UPI001CD6DB5F|nr:alpha/beta hydrolase [Pseudooceanicola nanhaiensis]MCA0919611.1 alpha/beta hydrolase [Pseudooceanicola nanhaiensis]